MSEQRIAGMSHKHPEGSRHVLSLRDGTGEEIFEWRGDSWGRPGNPYQTKWNYMLALGWRYVRPATTSDQEAGE